MGSVCNTPDPPRVNMVIYHKDCPDGFGAAFAAWLVLGNRATYHGALHGDAPPPNFRGKHIVVCDYAFPRATTVMMLGQAASMITLDHHDTAAADLLGVSNCVFDSSSSGAVMAWRFFHGPAQSVPRLLLHIQDRDLWRFDLPDTKALMAHIDQLPINFESWLPYCNPHDVITTERNLQKATMEGRHVARFIQSEIEKIGRRGILRIMKGHTVVVINTNQWISDVGSFMANRNLKVAKFAVVWFYDHAKKIIKVSLRSANSEVHLGEFAKTFFEGGGHASSAAFKWKKGIEDLFDKSPDQSLGAKTRDQANSQQRLGVNAALFVPQSPPTALGSTIPTETRRENYSSSQSSLVQACSSCSSCSVVVDEKKL